MYYVRLDYGIIMWTGGTCKKIISYMNYSASRWSIVKELRYCSRANKLL